MLLALAEELLSSTEKLQEMCLCYGKDRMGSLTKDAVLALSEHAFGNPKLASWKYLKSKQSITTEAVKGVKVLIRLNWKFDPWIASSSPWIRVHSKQVDKLRKTIVEPKKYDFLVSQPMQKIWRKYGKPRSSVSFVEDEPNAARHERYIDDVPAFIEEVISTCETQFLNDFDLTSEEAFLRSLPDKYTFNAHPEIQPIGYILKEVLLGNKNAVRSFIDHGDLPAGRLETISGDIKKIEEYLATL